MTGGSIGMMARVIRLVVVVSSTIALWACDPCPPGPPQDLIFLLRNPDQETQQLIDQCLDPTRNDCFPLCEKLIGTTSATYIVHCEIHPQTDPAYVQVHVGLDIDSCE